MTSRGRASVTVLVALATVAVLAVLPSYSSQSCSADRFNQQICTETDSRTIPEENGDGILLILSIPAAIAAIGVVRPRRNVLLGVAVVVTVLMVPAMLSVGVFYAPTAVVAWLVFADADRRRQTAVTTAGGAP
ncbi:MAG: hypothetical protein V7636_746 [Actinomycetota bacterium]